ncbi:MAG TPA: hypothetical protein VF244_09935 [Acidimicrobiales bacterium]
MRGKGRRSSEGLGGPLLRRRDVLRLAGAAGVGTAVADLVVLAPAAGAKPTSTSPSTRTVYRRSPLGRTTCNACKAHDANRYYRTATAAASDKPHPGCDCAIVSHKIPVNQWNAYFTHAGADRTKWDVRWQKNGKGA